MFSKHARYVTRGVNELVGTDIQSAIWSIVDITLNEGIEMDYLQIFSLTVTHVGDAAHQRIRHRQEQPGRKKVYDISGIQKPVSGETIWVIDSGQHCTMLLPSEY